jgi:NADPH:quinone reductase-like Zn-dependent oxidoreductase
MRLHAGANAPATDAPALKSWSCPRFIRKARTEKGQGVLVNGATGAIGSAAVQLPKCRCQRYRGMWAQTTSSSSGDLVPAKVIDYTSEDFAKDPGSYDVVLDAVGKSSFGRCKRLLKPRGIYLSSELGARCQNPFSHQSSGPRQEVHVPVPQV